MVRRFVEDEQIVLAGEEPSERHALALPAGQLVGADVAERAHAEPVEHGGALPATADRGIDRAGRQHRILVEHADACAASPSHRACLGRRDPGQVAQQRGLARAVQTDHAQPVTGRHRHRQIREQRTVGAGGREAFGIDADHGRRS